MMPAPKYERKDRKYFGEILRFERKRASLNIHTVSLLTEIGESTLRYYENGVYLPTVDTFFALVKFYRKYAEYLGVFTIDKKDDFLLL